MRRSWPGSPRRRRGNGCGFSVADAFVRSRDVLYLLTETQSAAAPVIAAITDRVMRAGIRAADRAGGRLDPPFALILDEAAPISAGSLTCPACTPTWAGA